jgi:hypothetical protein
VNREKHPLQAERLQPENLADKKEGARVDVADKRHRQMPRIQRRDSKNKGRGQQARKKQAAKKQAKAP